MAYADSQLRGALLEEVILYLLRTSGFDPVLGPGSDPTLRNGRSGLEVRGRGAYHQIDAIADFSFSPPFTNPQRLLLEAKFYRNRIGVEVVRNALGVLKDTCEGWMIDPDSGLPAEGKRYHYLYALFAASEFSVPSQNYAFAHDIFLLPLRDSSYFHPVIHVLDNISFEHADDRPSIKVLRRWVRNRLIEESFLGDEEINADFSQPLTQLIVAARRQGFGFVTMFGGQFPAFLVAAPGRGPEEFAEINDVRIRKRGAEWFIENTRGDAVLSFDLPEAIFNRYEENGRLSRAAMLNIKGDLMQSFFAFHRHEGRLRLIQFRLEEEWFHSIREQQMAR